MWRVLGQDAKLLGTFKVGEWVEPTCNEFVEDLEC